MKKSVKISKTYEVKVWAYLEVDVDENGNLDEDYIDCELDNLESDANLDLANLGVESDYLSDYYCTDQSIKWLKGE